MDESRPLVCPLLNDDTGPDPCRRAECAWWVRGAEQCSIPRIADYLSYMAGDVEILAENSRAHKEVPK